MHCMMDTARDFATKVDIAPGLKVGRIRQRLALEIAYRSEDILYALCKYSILRIEHEFPFRNRKHLQHGYLPGEQD